MENKNKLITTMQTLILALGFIYLIEARVMFKYYNLKALAWQILYFISWIFIIYATARMPRKSLRKWEAILYFVLDIICVGIIVHSVFYVGVAFEDFLGEEDPGIGYMFMMFLCGIPYFTVTLILSIISIVKIGFSKQKRDFTQDTTISVKELETTKQKEELNLEEYCSYCGKVIKSNANYCKHCGKKKE